MRRLGVVGAVGLGLACASVSGMATGEPAPAAVVASAQETTSTLLDGVFTAAQARRGRQVYSRDCASCHGPEMKGGEMAPGIAGSGFMVFWTELPVGSMFERIKVSMPEDGPGRLTDKEYADVVAYIFDANGYPAGEVELPADKAELDKIMIVAAE
ncbi:MAG: cytochrome c [Acidobacteria bacterium]|nr:cytochrome c [Acidobacteriota bacterium]